MVIESTPVIFCIAAAACALFGICFVAFVSDVVRHTPFARLVAASIFVFAAVRFGGAKNGAAYSPLQGSSAPQAVSGLPRSGGGGGSDVTNLCFTGMSVSSSAVALSIAWPADLLGDGTTMDLFVKVWSLTNRWEWIGCIDVSADDTNAEFAVDLVSLPGVTNAPSAAFFRVVDRASCASTMVDSDGDGIPDVYELHNGTNPYVSDSASSPVLRVGAGGDYATIDAALADSREYSIIALSPGEQILSSSLVMPDYPVMLTGPGDGYAVLRSTADVAVVMLRDGQNSETLFRNLHLVLDRESGMQMGFWIGDGLPLAGSLGASPSFENVRVRAPHPDTFYHGWHCYGDDGGIVLVSNCTMNAAGANNAIGVYSKGGQAVEVADCHFVNFLSTNGNCAVYIDDAPGFSTGPDVFILPATNELGISWAGYSLDVDYAAEADSDGDGLSDYVEIFTYDTDPWLADSDGDGVSDGDEVAESTSPKDIYSYNRHITVIVTVSDGYEGVTNYVALGEPYAGQWTNVIFTTIGPLTNTIVVVDGMPTNVVAFSDFDRDGEYSPDIDGLASEQVVWNVGSATARLHLTLPDSDNDGIPNWWEIANASAGLSLTNSADAYLDPDGDGLINLHEYWADCDPLVYDGTNTVLSIMARSVDERLTNTTCSCIYSNYNQSGVFEGLQKNVNSWSYGIDLSCASPWNGWHSNFEAGVLLTRRHVLFAKHYLFQHGEGNRRLYFRPRDGGVYFGEVIATNVSMHTDIAVALLGDDVPESISTVSVLPTNYAEYIGNGCGLPMLTLDYQEQALVHDVVAFPASHGNVAAMYPVNPLRLANTEPIVVGDSGNPRFLLMGSTPILVSTLWTGPNSPAAGPFITSWRNEIQYLIDELSCGEGLNTNDYRLVEYDLSRHPRLTR